MGVKGWHSRGYLPHYDGPGVIQHIVFHLHDALIAGEPPGDDVLDKGLGSALLSSEVGARVVAEALLHDDGRKYELHAWCVMPNHVHVLVLVTPQYELGAVVREWKTITARRINASRGVKGPVWARDYFDRFVRDHKQYETAKLYIERNPVAAQLCEAPADWRFSSAGWAG